MDNNKIIYSLNEEDIQTVSLELLERNLTQEEIESIIPLIEEKINWFDAIADSINEAFESKQNYEN